MFTCQTSSRMGYWLGEGPTTKRHYSLTDFRGKKRGTTEALKRQNQRRSNFNVNVEHCNSREKEEKKLNLGAYELKHEDTTKEKKYWKNNKETSHKNWERKILKKLKRVTKIWSSIMPRSIQVKPSLVGERFRRYVSKMFR